MSYLWYLLWTATGGGWVFIDARARHAKLYWVAAVAIAGPIGLAAYLAFRPLRRGEAREGGRAWQFLSLVVVSWTALLALAALWNVAWPVVDLATIGVAWACVALPALVVGSGAQAQHHGARSHGRARSVLGPWFSAMRANRRWARLHLPRMRQGIFDRTTVLRRMRRLARRERLIAAYFTATNATSTSTSRGRRATCTVARAGGIWSLK